MNINSMIKKLLIYLNYTNYINKTNISYSTIYYNKYSFKYNTIITKITLTKWVKEDEKNIVLDKWEELSKYQLIETLQELADKTLN